MQGPRIGQLHAQCYLGMRLALAHEARNQLPHKAAVWAYIGSWDGCREMLAMAHAPDALLLPTGSSWPTAGGLTLAH